MKRPTPKTDRKLYAATRAKKSQKAEIKDLNAKIAAIEAERNQ
jgi:hypothetical protein